MVIIVNMSIIGSHHNKLLHNNNNTFMGPQPLPLETHGSKKQTVILIIKTNKQTNKPLGFLLIKELLVYLEHFMFLVLTWVFLPLKIEADLLKIERGTETFQKCQIDLFIWFI